jgi:lysophospholipase L1-like esterase
MLNKDPLSRNFPQFTFSRIDFVVMSISLGYAALGGALITRPIARARFVALTYTLLFAAVAAETTLRLKPQEPRLPRTPGREVWEVSTEQMPGVEPRVVVSFNKLGMRTPEVPLDQAAIKVLCVGGSTTECVYITDEKTWPWLLQQELAKRLDKSVFVGNAGKSSTFTLHHDYLLRHYEAGKQFDYVLVLCGANDMGNLLRGGYTLSAEYVPQEALTGEPDIETTVPVPYYRHLRLVRAVYRLRGARRRPKVLEETTVTVDSMGKWIRERRGVRAEALRTNPRSDIPGGLDDAVGTYRDNLRAIIEACRQNRQSVVFMTQPSLYRAGLSDQEKGLLWQSSPRGTFQPETLEAILDKYNGAVIDVCKQEGVDCIDLASLMPKDASNFYDDFHFNVNGCRRVAQVVTDYLAKKVTGQTR